MLKSRAATLLVIVGALIVSCHSRALATQSYMNSYNANQYKTSAWVNRCDLCHVSAAGDGARNSFGQYFESHGNSFSQGIRDAFPSRFADASNFVTNVNWSVTVTDMTPTTEGGLDITLSSSPTNAGTAMDYKIVASKAVQKYITLSSTTGTISLGTSIGSDTVTVNPRAALSTRKMQKQLAKGPLSLKLTLIPLNNDGTSATSEKGTITIKVFSD